MTHPALLSRREFLIRGTALGGALAIGVQFHPDAGAAADAASGEVTPWVVIQPDETVIIRIARSELGQGSFTGLAQLVAEELECDWNNVRSEYADVNEHVRRNRAWGAMSTGGSRSIRESQEVLRKAGAAAREMLVAAAARQWDADPSECVAAKGVITHKPTGRTVTFGQVAAAAAAMDVPQSPKLKDPKDWKIIGTSPRRFDIPDKTTGKQIYAADVQLPGMLHASIRQCPVFGGKVRTYEEDKLLGMRGVKKVVAGLDWVAVVADNWWRANEAMKALP
ncbi:MAG: xanthine dehydrogenase family protein molybdopterin-binding subunit, partial [Betaproteobacteria bacterium]|nr:xanthine dehydrogenase family protein molybdopterin-binding subunit [Betaproteobacteria bacterium]